VEYVWNGSQIIHGRFQKIIWRFVVLLETSLKQIKMALFYIPFILGFDAMPGIPGEAMPALPAPGAEPKKDDADSLRKNMFKPSFLPPATSPDQRKDQDLDSK
jgi:hypothetical protein